MGQCKHWNLSLTVNEEKTLWMFHLSRKWQKRPETVSLDVSWFELNAKISVMSKSKSHTMNFIALSSWAKAQLKAVDTIGNYSK